MIEAPGGSRSDPMMVAVGFNPRKNARHVSSVAERRLSWVDTVLLARRLALAPPPNP